MSASKLQLRSVQPRQAVLPSTLVRHVAPPQPELRCPECRSILYTRRNKRCNICGEDLPQTVLFPQEVAGRLKAMLEVEKSKHRQWMRKWQ